MTLEETILKIKKLREEIKEAEKVKCTCSGFVLQYEGACYCKAASIKAEARNNFWKVIYQL